MKILKTARAALLVGAACFALYQPEATGQTSEALMDALVRKGILTEQEAEDIKSDLAKENRSVNKLALPGKTTKSLSFSGDVRGRYESFYYDNAAGVDRQRFRYRLRFGATAALTDDFEAGLRLTSSEAASGGSGGDPISGNTTMQDNGSKKFIYLDTAYAKWKALNTPEWQLATTIGKMENPFVFSDMVFDGDYTPEGAALQFGHAFNAQHSVKLAAGIFLLDEVSSSSKDPYMSGAQARLESVWSPKVATSFGAGILAIANDQQLNASRSAGFSSTSGTNVVGVSTWTVPDQNRGNSRTALAGTTVTGGNLLNNFNPVIADASVTYTLDKFPLYAGAFPIKLAGDFMHNPGADSENNAWSAGVTFGKAGKKGSWEVSYRYKYLEADAWYEELVDSDFGAYYQAAPAGGGTGYGAGTNVKGHVLKAAYSPYDALTLGVTALFTDLINKSPATSESATTRIQVDAVVKF
jgi:hypothetical protein